MTVIRNYLDEDVVLVIEIFFVEVDLLPVRNGFGGDERGIFVVGKGGDKTGRFDSFF
jgi:hypothetical protein